MDTDRHELTTLNGKSLFDRVVVILEQVRTNVVRTVKSEMAAELNLTENGVNYHLRKLQQTNRLKRVGGRKQGHWQVR